MDRVGDRKRRSKADAAVINAGGIKKDLPAGDCSVGDVYDTGFLDAEAFMEYAQSKGTLAPVDTGVSYVPAL